MFASTAQEAIVKRDRDKNTSIKANEKIGYLKFSHNKYI